MAINRFLVCFGLCALVSLTAQRCWYDNAEDLYGPVDTDTVSTFSGGVFPIIETRCAIPGCHVTGSAGRVALTTYEQVELAIQNSNLEKRVVIDRSMPSGTTLSQSQIDKFKKWIDAGYPNN